ncbi:hypothetical protein [Streptomyces sp. NPDC058739]|uniref:hypothetical protein n=1 Tax=Streptomyces sp. NPDC058739 TaxID=3346618 RepID=UPI00369C5B4B
MHCPARPGPRRARSVVLTLLAALLLVMSPTGADSTASAPKAIVSKGTAAASATSAASTTSVSPAVAAHPDTADAQVATGSAHPDADRYDKPRADDESATARTARAAAVRDLRGDHAAPRDQLTVCSRTGFVPLPRSLSREAGTGPVPPCEPRQNPDRGRAPPVASGI